jgi:hypothetical protein
MQVSAYIGWASLHRIWKRSGKRSAAPSRNLNRASEVLERIHGFIKKASPRKESFAINEAVHEVRLGPT